MYVAVKGGEKAIANAHRLLADARRGDRTIPQIQHEQILGEAELDFELGDALVCIGCCVGGCHAPVFTSWLRGRAWR